MKQPRRSWTALILKSTVGAASEANAGATCTIIIPKIPPKKSLLDVAGPSNLGGLVPIVPWYFNFELDSDNADILQKESSTSGAPPLNSYFCMDDRQTAKYDFRMGASSSDPWNSARSEIGPLKRRTNNGACKLLLLPHVPEQLDRPRPVSGVVIVGVGSTFGRLGGMARG